MTLRCWRSRTKPWPEYGNCKTRIAARQTHRRLRVPSRSPSPVLRAAELALRTALLLDPRSVAKRIALVQHRSGLPIDVRIEGAHRLPGACEKALYRIVQEALAHVLKPARATREGFSMLGVVMANVRIPLTPG